MIPLLTAAQVRELDRLTIETIGLPGVVLMEAAGRALAREAERLLPEPGRVVIVCGKGNNGGDGFVAARVLESAGYEVTCLLLSPPDAYQGDAATHLRVLQALDADLRPASAEAAVGGPRRARRGESGADPLATADLILDCLLGTGADGPPRPDYAAVIERINAADAPVLACDLPSGVAADTGAVHEPHVVAERTCSFAAWKPGLAVGPGAVACGEVTVHDIGIPPALYGVVFDDGPHLAEAGDLAELVTPRPADWHKGDAGRVLILGGSPGYGGAAVMAAHGAVKGGAGLVTLGLPESLPQMLPTVPIEVMCRLLPAPTGQLEAASLEALADLLDRFDALAVGPGLGLEAAPWSLVEALIARPQPLVLDADALTLLARQGSARLDGSRVVLTPHQGEAARLLATTPEAIQADRLGAAEQLVAQYGGVVLLKGHHTIVAGPDSRPIIIPTGTPAMASGGMGDVLTGLLAALLGQGLDGFEAACLGAWLHGDAGTRAAGGCDSGLLATELLAALPQARQALLEVE